MNDIICLSHNETYFKVQKKIKRDSRSFQNDTKNKIGAEFSIYVVAESTTISITCYALKERPHKVVFRRHSTTYHCCTSRYPTNIDYVAIKNQGSKNTHHSHKTICYSIRTTNPLRSRLLLLQDTQKKTCQSFRNNEHIYPDTELLLFITDLQLGDNSLQLPSTRSYLLATRISIIR